MCSKAKEIVASLGRELPSRDLIDYVSVLLVVKKHGPIGRPSLSRILGLGDKRTRNILARLRATGLIESSRAGAVVTEAAAKLFEGVDCLHRDSYTIAVLPCSNWGSEFVARNVIALRDAIVIALSDPHVLEVIGWLDADSLVLPGVTASIAEKYKTLINASTCPGQCLVGLFRGSSTCYRCCASLLHAASTL
ncbi:MAG TPA: hypothetical protein EYH50_00880 [Pyrodictium delaneyi]|uniref:Uncharacterized protein n=1 Tax=Pyrodictium delaneyi TaxID=1273541 RepID=A0A832ZTX9_9CREN|nr:hypothetical protein [Pyrodictium delaneyi]